MKIAQHNGNLWKVASPMSGFQVTMEKVLGRNICQALFLLCGLIKAVILGGVQNNMRTRGSAHVFRRRSSATKVQPNLYLFHKTSSRILRKVSCPGVHLTRLQFI